MAFLISNMHKVITPVLAASRAAFSTSRLQLAPKVQYPAPDFRGTAVVDGEFKEIKLSDFSTKYVVLLFYPLDFTFVCPTELVSFSEKASKFKELDTQVIGVSTDSEYSHLAWTNVAKSEGGVGKLNFPLLSDFNKKISTDYDVLLEAGMALRGLFIIDGNGVLRHMSINDLPVGRNAEETLRLVRAFRFTDKHGEVCPANWNPESNPSTIKPNPKESKEYFKKANS